MIDFILDPPSEAASLERWEAWRAELQNLDQEDPVVRYEMEWADYEVSRKRGLVSTPPAAAA